MVAVVAIDEKGRILLPREFRKKIKTKRFTVTSHGEKIELEPIKTVSELRGKYRDLIKSEWEELEEQGEAYVDSRKR